MSTPDRRQAALDAYLRRPTAAHLDRLRATLEGELADRVGLFTEDPGAIARALDTALAAFAAAARPGARVNWLAWIAAAAMAAACPRPDGACWFDAVAARFRGKLAERRALVLGVILTLDGRCQWALLRARMRPKGPGPAVAARCRRNLLERIDLTSA